MSDELIDDHALQSLVTAAPLPGDLLWVQAQCALRELQRRRAAEKETKVLLEWLWQRKDSCISIEPEGFEAVVWNPQNRNTQIESGYFATITEAIEALRAKVEG